MRYLLLGLTFFSLLTVECFGDDLYVWDFGRVKEGVILKHKFLLKNDSSKIVNIKSVNTSCGCTTSEVKKKRLSPKETTYIEVKFDTKGYSGTIQQYVYVHTDGSNNPILRFTVKAEVLTSGGLEKS